MADVGFLCSRQHEGEVSMLKLLCAALTGAMLISASASAKPVAGTIVSDIADGMSCKMTFEVAELRTPKVPGAPLGAYPDDVYLSLVAVGDPMNTLCLRVERAGEIKLDGAANAGRGVGFVPGERFNATLMYQQLEHGGLAYQAYQYLVVIESGAGAPGVYEGLTLLP
jgi:hypothetical protein